MPSQLPNLFGGPGFGKREGPGDALPQPSPYASFYAPAEPSYSETSQRSIPQEPRPEPSPYASSYAPSHPEPSGGGYQPSYDQPRQFGFSGGTGGYGNVGSGFSGSFGYGAPPEPRPQTDDANPDLSQNNREFGYSGPPGFPNPQPGFGF